jgi:hypothetical protein
VVTAIETWFDKVARIGAQIPGVASNAVYAAGTAGQTGVQPMTDTLLALPAFVLAFDGTEIRSSNWEQQEHTLRAEIWVARTPIEERYAQLVGFVDAVMDTFPPRAKPDAEVQSVLILGFDAIRARDWGDEKFLTLPFRIQVMRRRSTAYVPAGP